MPTQELTTLLPPVAPTLNLGAASGTYTASGFTKIAANAIVTGDTTDKILGLQVRIDSGSGTLGVVNGTTLQPASGTVGKIGYAYNDATKLLRLTDTSSDLSAVGSDFQDVLRNVVIQNASGTVSISANLGKPVYRSENGHYYEFVSLPTSGDQALPTWTSSKTAAEASRFLGLQGYLASVTSAEENSFLKASFDSKGWIGAQADASRKWTWVGAASPENGKSFWIGNTDGSFANADIKYANWDQNPAEPNNFDGKESYAQFTTGGVWNDLADAPTRDRNADRYNPDGYWIEYGGDAGTENLRSTRGTISLTQGSGPTGASALDLVFYDPASGKVSFAFVGANNTIGSESLSGDTPLLTFNSNNTPYEGLADWRLVTASIDVDKDGTKDTLYTNKNNGSVVVAFGAIKTGSTTREYGVRSSAFVTIGGVLGTARPADGWSIEFASDKIGVGGTPGIFWLNTITGLTAIWTLSAPTGGTTATTSLAVTGNVGGNSGWRAIGDGEFNQDPTTSREVLWLNSKNNEVATWSLNSGRTTWDVKYALAGRVVPTGWSVSAIGNIAGGAGNDNIVWQNGSRVLVWNMRDAAAISLTEIAVIPTDRIKTVADVDADGILDLVGQNDGNGTIATYALTSSFALKNTAAPRAQYFAANNPGGSYRPGKNGSGPALELVNVAQYGA